MLLLFAPCISESGANPTIKGAGFQQISPSCSSFLCHQLPCPLQNNDNSDKMIMPPATSQQHLETARQHQHIQPTGQRRQHHREDVEQFERINNAGAGRLQPRPTQVNSHRDIVPVVREALAQWDHPLIDFLEQITGFHRDKLFFGFCVFVTFYLVVGPGNGLLCNLIGFAYPAYQSVLAIRSEQKEDDIQWLMYWCVFAVFSMVDFFADALNQIIPLYWLLKTVFLLYLALPQTYGAHNIYVRYVDPLVDWLNEQMRQLGIRV